MEAFRKYKYKEYDSTGQVNCKWLVMLVFTVKDA
jgi:hypothetical protein